MSIINFKQLSKSKGYRSLKQAYIDTVINGRLFSSKEELYKKFQWVINRAKHYSHCSGKSVEIILNEWEDERNYSWENYYQNGRQPKLHSKCLKPQSIKGICKYYKEWQCSSSTQVKHRICKLIQEQQAKYSTKKKKRWTSHEKKHFKKYGFH